MRKKTHYEYENELFQGEIDYFPLEEYKGTHIPILHECLNGHKWLARPKHILNGHGCPSCAGNKLKTDLEYKDQIVDRPLINIEPYIRDYVAIEHKCLDCDNIWKAAPSYIIQGTGCPMCCTGSFKNDKPGTLYHVSLDYLGDTYYKIGITNNSVQQRFKQDWKRLNMALIWKLTFEIGKDARVLESKLLRCYDRVRGIKPLRGKGNTELLYEQIECPIK